MPLAATLAITALMPPAVTLVTAASMPTAATLPTGRPTKRLRDGRAKLAVAEIASDAGLSAPATSLAFGLRTVASIGEAVCRGGGFRRRIHVS